MSTPFRLVDSHCHIDMPQLDADREGVVARGREAGLVEMLVVGGVDEGDGHRRALQVAESFGRVLDHLGLSNPPEHCALDEALGVG